MDHTSVPDPTRTMSMKIRPIWIVPSMVFVVMIVFIAMVTLLLQKQERTHIQATISTNAGVIEHDIKHHLTSYILALLRMANRIENQPHYRPEEWLKDARLYTQHFDGYLALAWTSEDGPADMVTYENPQPDSGSDAINWYNLTLQSLQVQEVPLISQPFVLNNGKKALAIAVPISGARKPVGSIVGIFEITSLFHSLLEEHRNMGYALRLEEQGRLIYENNTQPTLSDPTWVKHISVPIYHQTMDLTVWPSVEEQQVLMGSPVFHLPYYVAPFIAFLMSMAVYFAMGSRRSAASLSDSNRLLSEQLSKLENAQSVIHKLSHAIEQNISSIVISDTNGVIEYCNTQFKKKTHVSGKNTRGKRLGDLNQINLSHNKYKEMLGELANGRSWEGEILTKYKGGEPYWEFVTASPIRERNGEITNYLYVLHDISEKKIYQQQIEYQESHDRLTGLPNRELMLDRLDQAMLYAKRQGRNVAVLFLGIDNFKYINDTIGHAGGDLLLKQIAGRMSDCVRENDTVCRHGGDEFVIVLADVGRSEDAELVVEKVVDTITKPYTIEGKNLTVGVSVGISLYPDDDNKAERLLVKANTALYLLKSDAKGEVLRYRSDMSISSSDRLELENDLRMALAKNELELHYQPQVDMHSGKVVGVEALLRWNHPTRGQVSPAMFIPIAEETGLIMPIGEWVMHTACRQAKQWLEVQRTPVRMAVNVSAKQFARQDVAQLIDRALEQSGLEPKFLEIELTESLLMQNVERTTSVLSYVKKRGVSVAVDDFGTGYSSLNYLRLFPIDKLKIDRVFVRDITHDPGAAAIAMSVISMARTLNLSVIAEGVETEAQLSALYHHRCDEIQGFYFCRPQNAEDITRLLHEDQRLDSRYKEQGTGKKTLLLVDDEKNVLASLVRTLRGERYEVMTATSAHEALEILATHQVDVVMSDYKMPGMLGTSFLGYVKKLYPETVRIIITGQADINLIVDAINEVEIFKLITKPWEPDDLRKHIAMAFQQNEIVRHNARLNDELKMIDTCLQ